MKRIHLFEFTDQAWYSDVFRRMQTDYLQFAASLGSGHQYLIPLFKKALEHAGTREIVDLCSGGAGPWLHLMNQLEQAGLTVTVTLTDLYPHPDAIRRWMGKSKRRITYLAQPVDAADVPTTLKGMRTLFEGFHHFKPDQAVKILRDAAVKRAAIGIFDASLKPPFDTILLILSPLITVVSYYLLTPFIRPLTLSRLLWTYLVPLVPLATAWDGVVSLLRTYSPQELRELAAACPAKGYTWEAGYTPTGTPVFLFTYLIGYPEIG